MQCGRYLYGKEASASERRHRDHILCPARIYQHDLGQHQRRACTKRLKGPQPAPNAAESLAQHETIILHVTHPKRA